MSSVKKIVALSVIALLGCSGMAVGSLNQAHAAMAPAGHLVVASADQETQPGDDQGMMTEQPETGDQGQNTEIMPGSEDPYPSDMDSQPSDQQEQAPADQNQDQDQNAPSQL